MLYVLAVRTGKEGTGGACTVYIDISYDIVGRVSGEVWGDGLHISGRLVRAFWVRDKKIYSDFSGF